MRTIEPLPEELQDILFRSGNRTIVLVEGPTDEEIFTEWYQDQLNVLYFHPAGGCTVVKNTLEKLLSFSKRKTIYGIIDRDFRDEVEIEASLNNEESHLFILQRYAIENYLLEPVVLSEELRVYYGNNREAPTPMSIERKLLELCQQLTILMAANWVFIDIERYLQLEDGISHFEEAHEILSRPEILMQASNRSGLSEAELEPRLREKETRLINALTTLSNAHAYINGKHLLHQVYQFYIARVQRGLNKEYLKRLLARTVKKMGLSEEIHQLIENRILNNQIIPQ